ncbi:hypothetical protein [Alysiella filiformis]|nr:hypothetical protein [Alysiella filiformis]QMT31252.1 hypothetical protein H3L97_11225 [Alysiella filiformis]UBQ55747.1 hypothetical protein JF568_09245 [Alysiella filiformis DSM 16848]
MRTTHHSTEIKAQFYGMPRTQSVGVAAQRHVRKPKCAKLLYLTRF